MIRVVGSWLKRGNNEGSLRSIVGAHHVVSCNSEVSRFTAARVEGATVQYADLPQLLPNVQQ